MIALLVQRRLGVYELLIMLTCGLLATPAIASEINIASYVLKQDIYEQLGLDPSQPLTETDMLNLKELHCFTHNSIGEITMPCIAHLESFTGLEYAVNLEKLILTQLVVKDIPFLSQVEKLRTLAIGGGYIDSLSDVFSITQLEELRLAVRSNSMRNPFTNLSGIENLSNLKRLSVSMPHLNDLSALRKIPHLEELYIGQGAITTYQPISSLTNLKQLRMASQNIDDINFLNGLESLETVTLNWNNIEDISPLADMHNLKQLYLLGNPLNSDAHNIYIPQILANNPDIDLYYDPIPEPSTLILLSIGLFALISAKKRTHKQ